MRVEKTKQIVADGLFQLLKKHSFDDVTVKMICDEAGIGRSTFYRLYRDKQEVIVSFFEFQYDQIRENNQDPKQYSKMMGEYFNLLKQYQEFYKRALSVKDQNSLMDHIKQTGEEYYIQHLEKSFRRSLTERERLVIRAFAVGLTAIHQEWIKGGFTAEPVFLAEAALDLMPGWMRGIFE